jgi:Tol biopolymer transport system component
VRVDGLDERALATGAHPAWSPDGKRIAFDRDGQIVSVRWYGGGVRLVTDGEDPAYAPNGRLAVVRDGQIFVAGQVVAEGTSPAWAPDGRRLAYVRDDVIYVGEQTIHDGEQPAWRPPERARELLPAFDQRAPSGLTIAAGAGRWLLGFTSLVDNVGLGPSELVGVRPPGRPA